MHGKVIYQITIITFLFNKGYMDTHPTHAEARRNDLDTDDSPLKSPPSP